MKTRKQLTPRQQYYRALRHKLPADLVARALFKRKESRGVTHHENNH